MHTHKTDQRNEVITIFNKLLNEVDDSPSLLFSAGLHPWNADQLSLEALSFSLDQYAVCEKLVAFGETGLDKVCKIPMLIQQDVFELHLKKGVEYNKPLILHCVKAWDELIEISANYSTIKILHGFNGSIQLTARLIKNGFYFSIGKAILDPSSKIQSALHRIPLSSLFCETDTSDISIQAIYHGISQRLNLTEKELRNIIYDNFVRLRSI